MFGYYFQLGMRSLRRNPVLTALMVIAIGFGVAASMITWSVFRVVSGNPIPQKSGRLFTVLIDNRGPQYNDDGEPPEALTYTDANAMIRAHKAPHQTLFYPISLAVLPDGNRSLPLKAIGYATTADFFGMFDVPFEYGSAWSAQDDTRRAGVVVLSHQFNEQLFGGADSVGREVDLSGHIYRVVGVTRHFDPKPRYFDLFGGSAFDDPMQVYIPFNRADDLQINTAGRNTCGGAPDTGVGTGREGWLRGECSWIPVWVQLDTPAQVADYRAFLEGYAAKQQRAGRFRWPPNVRLRDVTDWLAFEHVVPPESRISLVVSIGFFVICLVNTIGLLLAKFMRRSAEIGVRRALGAPRGEIYRQFLIEAGTVGAAGGVLGVLLTAVGVGGVGLLFAPRIARLAQVDLPLMALTLLVAVVATVVAAFYPTWRAAKVQPAWQLKSN
ncbi:ABC transporter permease [Frateuria hangzhouensis]|uniref:ABC transporter permease n=1 Tax=Frateuria hangzhouensis TaxID=2995589 RepID=UPI0022608F95|nr:ABC transporter permease [Frateuria sp. STR12]MCX7513677.1 ABC transporter permease [Frateuria sp. STR12]